MIKGLLCSQMCSLVTLRRGVATTRGGSLAKEIDTQASISGRLRRQNECCRVHGVDVICIRNGWIDG